ncbi:hypothetical protein H2199_004223 [Coniosporium tulheliwenetii]|uniref:Uncharacterized protein n=1 Tax=Coniosporium tulheliwenetii TaxID=3383036 RepID=A0ACC2Z775_9PEZI|nr:hypothetical protein H2199_004223 [Cladosporium sp. JES 115]
MPLPAASPVEERPRSLKTSGRTHSDRARREPSPKRPGLLSLLTRSITEPLPPPKERVTTRQRAPTSTDRDEHRHRKYRSPEEEAEHRARKEARRREKEAKEASTAPVEPSKDPGPEPAIETIPEEPPRHLRRTDTAPRNDQDQDASRAIGLDQVEQRPKDRRQAVEKANGTNEARGAKGAKGDPHYHRNHSRRGEAGSGVG